MSVIHYCGQSAGKDSTATALWLIHESGVPKDSIRFTFCNTHNEHGFTYEHIQMLSDRYQSWGTGPIHWLEPERGFFDLAKWKGRFPTRKARFCTQFLKVVPSRNDVQALLRGGNDVIVYSGVRADESRERATLPDRGFDDMFGCEVVRPILRWSVQEVVAYHKRFDVPLNPLYYYGARRVGCFPCINSCKAEIRQIAKHFPERIDELRSMERGIGRISTFFARKTVPERFRSLTVDTAKGPMKVATIDDVVRWSQTGKGGNETGFLFDIWDEGLVCESGRGMCE